LEFQFDFKSSAYDFVSFVQYKSDHNLRNTFEQVVPDLVGEETFWKNYFYQIEMFKKQLDLPHRLSDKGEMVD
jgi:hypothetical protein